MTADGDGLSISDDLYIGLLFCHLLNFAVAHVQENVVDDGGEENEGEECNAKNLITGKNI